MTKVGGISHKFYRETRGMKVTGGQFVTGGTVLTRQGHKWHPGRNVVGRTHLSAGCDGIVFFTRKKSGFNRINTIINIRPIEDKQKESSPSKAADKK